MAFENPMRMDVLDGLDNPENEFGAGFDINTKVDATPKVELNSIEKQLESDATERKKGRRQRAMEAIAAALTVYSSKDPAKAAQQMIEMRMQLIESQKNRNFKEQQLNKEIEARQKGQEYQRETGMLEIQQRAVEEAKLQESGWEVEQKRLNLADSIADENATEADRVTSYNTARAAAYAADPALEPGVANQYAACVVSGGGDGCDTAELEGLRTTMLVKSQREEEASERQGKAAIINARVAQERNRLTEIGMIAESNPQPVMRNGVALIDEYGQPVTQPMGFQDAERIYMQNRGEDMGAVPSGLQSPEQKQAQAADITIQAGNAIKGGDTQSIGTYITNYNASGQQDDVFVSLFSELNAPLNEVAKAAEDLGIPRARVVQSLGESIGKQLADDGIGRGREGDAAIRRMIATNPDITKNEANTVMYYAQQAQQSLGSFIWDATIGRLEEGMEKRINEGN